MRRLAFLAAVSTLGLALGGCDECAGTPSCRNFPQISYGGQFIEHKTGRPVSGVSIRFIRRGGIEIERDTVAAISDGDGFFTLRVGSIYNGNVTGDLLVTPPANQPYTVPAITLATSETRGDGAFLGRLVVDPFLLLVGHVRDRVTLTPLPDATVTMRRTSGGRLNEDVRTFTTDFGGQFAWVDPTIVEPGTINATFEITAPGYPRTFVVPREIPMQYRDGDMAFVILPVGSGLAYSGATGRRVTGEQFPGATVEFRRTGGILTQPDQVTVSVTSNGSFDIPIQPLSDGTVTGELRVVPPAPFPPEVHSVALQTSDDDRVRFLGVYAYGAQAYLSARLHDAVTGTPLPAGTAVSVKRVGGLPLEWNTPPDGHGRALGENGLLEYQAPTADSGSVQFDLIVQLPSPFTWDTVRAISVPARYSDLPFDAGVLAVRRRQSP